MADRKVAMSVQIGGALRNTYLRVMQTAEERQKRLTGALQGTQKQLAAVARAREYERSLAELTRRQDAAGGSSEELAADIRRTQAGYDRARRAARTLGADVSDLTAEHRRLTHEAARAARQLKAMETRARAGAAFRRQWASTAATAGSVYGVGRLVAGAAEREQEALYLRTAFNPAEGAGDVGVQVGAAVRHIRDQVRHRLLADETELLDISYALHSAGLDAEAAGAGRAIVHKVATVTRGGATQVGQTMATVFNVLGPRAEESAEDAMSRIGGVLTRAQLKFQFADFGQLGEGMNYAINSAAAYRVSLEQTAAALGVLNTGGVVGSRAGTAFNAVLRNLRKASKELGFEIRRDADGMLDLVGTMEALDKATAHLDTDARAAAFQETFGDEGRAGVQPMLEMQPMLRGGLEGLVDPAIAAAIDENYSLFLDGSAGIWKRARQNISQVGWAWAESIRPATDAIGATLGRMGAFAADTLDAYPRLGQTIAVVGAAFVGFKTVLLGHLALLWLLPTAYPAAGDAIAGFGRSALAVASNPIPALGRANAALRARALATGGALRTAGASIAGFGRSALAVAVNPIPAMGRAMGALRAGAVAAATAVRVAGVAFLTSPIGWIALAIGSAAIAIVKYWQPVKAFFGGFFKGIKTGFGPLPRLLKPIVGFVGSIFRWFGRLFKPVDASAEALAGAASAGEVFGKVVGTALKIIWLPFGKILQGIGWIGKQVGRIAGAGFPGDALDTTPTPDEQPAAPPRTRRRGPPRPPAPAVAGAVLTGLTLPAAAQSVNLDAAAPDVGAAVSGLTLPAATRPVNVDAEVPDVGAAVSGLTLPAATQPVNLDVAVPDYDFDLPADLAALASGGLPAAPARTVHQTIQVGPIYVQVPAGADVEALVDELERRLEESVRRAAADAALAEDDLP